MEDVPAELKVRGPSALPYIHALVGMDAVLSSCYFVAELFSCEQGMVRIYRFQL